MNLSASPSVINGFSVPSNRSSVFSEVSIGYISDDRRVRMTSIKNSTHQTQSSFQGIKREIRSRS